MNLNTANPYTSRDRYISRHFRLVVKIGLGAVLVVIVVSWLASILLPPFQSFSVKLVTDLIVLGTAYYFYIIWEKRPIKLRCQHCKHIVLSNRPWVCGSCKEPNPDGNEHPFVDQCGHCKAEPKTFRCPHCKELIYMTEDEDKVNYAYSLNSPDEETRTDKMRKGRETIEDKQHVITTARYDITIAQLNKRLKELEEEAHTDKKSVSEAKRESLDKFFDAKSAVKRAAREKKAANADEFKGNRKACAEADAIVEMWVNNELAKGED